MRVLVATDAWRPQLNGVVRTYERLESEVRTLGVELVFLTPGEFRTVPCPTYPEIRLALPDHARTAELIRRMAPDAVRIATEGPVGWMARAYCRKRNLPFTTSFHTRYPEYISARFGIPTSWVYAVLRHFHNCAAGVLVSSESLAEELAGRGFKRLKPWTRGVDTALFRPRPDRLFGSKGPVFLNVGRVATEKNIASFLDLELPGTKVVVGDGPMLAELQARYPEVVFTGVKSGEELARCYSSADVFVFPSRTDTFGMVLLEAMASGLPVAAYPVTGPLDHVPSGVAGVLDHDLRRAAMAALALDRAAVRQHAMKYSWRAAAELFVDGVVRLGAAGASRGSTALDLGFARGVRHGAGHT